jgi:ferredoxin
MHLSKKLKPKGYEVVYTGNVILPMNSSFPGLQFIKKRAPQKSALMFEYAENTIKRASKMILSGKKYFECRGIANKIGGTAIRMVYKPFVRSFKRRYFVDPEKCNGCGICSSICPKEAITITERKASIDTEQCIFCLKCYNYCPQVAVLKGKKSADIVKYPRYKGLEGYDKPLKYR